MSCKQFELWLADLNPRFGTETGKTRPVLIIQTDMLNRIHPSTLICPITTNIKKAVSILRINLVAGEGGLIKDSSVMIDEIRAIDNNRLLKKLGSLPSHHIPTVKSNLKIILDL